MKLFLKSRLKRGFAAALVAASLGALFIAPAPGSDDKPEKIAKPSKKAEKKTEKKAEKKQLTGAELYAVHCNRCHAERYAAERTPAQWKTILLHMRVRANLPGDQAKEVLKFLQEQSGSP